MHGLVGTVVVALASSPLWAGYDAGRKAWDAGNPAQALSEWRKAADRAEAQKPGKARNLLDRRAT